ncbi:MAG: ATPase [Oscillospiraceae bacterium]|nr:ATPase [Oscillospiraceae bacterium]
MSIWTIAELILLPLLILILISLPIVVAVRRHMTGNKVRTALITNLCAFFAVLLCAVIFPTGGLIHAADAAEAVVNQSAGLGYLAAALSVGVGSIGCGIAVANAAPAAIGAVAEEPKSFGKALIFVALGEGVAIYGLLIAILILNKL